MNKVLLKKEFAQTQPFMKNAWYVAAMSKDIDAFNMFTRTIMNISVVIYRGADGKVIALHDRCPHRFLPLSKGKREGDQLVCAYHGLKFDGDGKCTHNPHGTGQIPTAAKVASYPIQEKYGFVWIWMGDKEKAEPSLLPDYSELESGHENSLGVTYMHVKANYQLILDNVMDLSHVDHVHGEIITTRGKLSPIVPKVTEKADNVTARWEWEQQPALLIFAPLLPDPSAPAAHFIEISWTAPGNIQLSVAAKQSGEFGKDDIGQYDLHSVTPETDTSTHYFFATRRNHVEADAGFNQMKIQAMHGAFENEDVPLIEAQQQEMGTTDIFSLNPVLMSNDLAAVKFRKKLAEVISRENSNA